MNIKEYIASGVVEAYVLGSLTDKECAEVEKNLAQFPELRQELSRVEATNETLLMQLAIEPPALVKAKIMEAIKPRSKAVPMGSSFIRWQYAAAASILVAVGAIYMAYDYRTLWKNSEFELNGLIAQNRQIAQDYNRVNMLLDKVESDLRVIDNPGFTKVVMQGTPNAPLAMASVYLNKQTQEVFLSIQNLKKLSQQNQYQLWAEIDGKMVDAGVFDDNISGLVKMKNVKATATVFAVTIEPRGGRPVPTVETLQVAGHVAKG